MYDTSLTRRDFSDICRRIGTVGSVEFPLQHNNNQQLATQEAIFQGPQPFREARKTSKHILGFGLDCVAQPSIQHRSHRGREDLDSCEVGADAITQGASNQFVSAIAEAPRLDGALSDKAEGESFADRTGVSVAWTSQVQLLAIAT